MNVKRLSWVLLIFAVAIIGYAMYVQKQKAANTPNEPTTQPATQPTTAPPTQPTADTSEASATRPAPEAPAPAKPAAPKPRPAPKPKSAAVPQRTLIGGLDAPDSDPYARYLFAVDTQDVGAAVHTVKLADYFATAKGKQLFDDDPAAFDRYVAEAPLQRGHYSMLNPVGGHLPFATGMVTIGEPNVQKPWEHDLAHRPWARLPADPNTPDNVQRVTYGKRLGNSGANPTPLLDIYKTYEVKKGDYSITLTLTLKNISDRPLTVSVDQAGPTGLPLEERRRGDGRQAAYAYLMAGDPPRRVQPMLKPHKELADMELGKPTDLGKSTDGDAALWVGAINKYFGSMMYLKPAEPGRLDANGRDAVFYVGAAEESESSRNWLTGVRVENIQLAPGTTTTLAFDVFVGPKKRDLFVDPDAPYYRPLYNELQYIGTIDLGGCFCAWDQLTLGMMWLLNLLATVAFGNYGVAIILLVLLVRLVLHPLTKKGQVSMAKMQKLAPRMAELKNKYADDKEAFQREQMKLYKEQGFTPILGCLPMLLQMPIWIALWTALNAVVELRHAAFLPVWITDLSAPDALFSWSTPLPLIGTHFNLLPILLTVAMFLQAKYNPQTAAATPEQAKQQKMMQFMMPVMMLFIFYNAPSGLTLYIMTSTFAGVIEQYFIRKHIREKEEAEAAAEVTVSMPGKAARGSRPKKPKGPNWVKRG